jgi:hypothetical protein
LVCTRGAIVFRGMGRGGYTGKAREGREREAARVVVRGSWAVTRPNDDGDDDDDDVATGVGVKVEVRLWRWRWRCGDVQRGFGVGVRWFERRLLWRRRVRRWVVCMGTVGGGTGDVGGGTHVTGWVKRRV